MENDPDIDKAFENSLKKYMNTKKEIEAFQAIRAEIHQTNDDGMEACRSFIHAIRDSSLDNKIDTLMEKYRKVKELLLEIHTDLQVNINNK